FPEPDRPPVRLYARHRPQCPARLPPAGLGLPAATLLPAALGQARARPTLYRTAEAPTPSESQAVWLSHQPVDLATVGPDLPCQGLDQPATGARDRSASPEASGDPLAQSQALDHQPRSGLPPQEAVTRPLAAL